MDIQTIDFSVDELITAELLWEHISVGDTIELEADLKKGRTVLLKAGEAYQVIAKHGRDQGAAFDAFYVQAGGVNDLIAVSPVFIANYTIADEHQTPC